MHTLLITGITTNKIMITRRKPVHPGVLLKEEVIIPLNLTLTEAAKYLGVSRKALSELINSHSSLSTEMAVRIAKATNTSPESWLNMQTNLDLWKVEQKKISVAIFPESKKQALGKT